MRGLEYKGLHRIEGPVIITSRSSNAGYNDVVAVYDRENKKRLGRIIDLSEDWAAIQIFGNSAGLSAEDSRVEFLEKPMKIRVGTGILGRVFNGLGEPIDGYGNIFSSKTYDINGFPINPYARIYPGDFIQTGISSIDGMNTLIRGQKLPIFSGNGLPHNRLAAQIVRQAKIINNSSAETEESQDFVIVFCAMGVNNDVARFFLDDFEQSGVLSRTAVFLSLADSPSLERLITPRCALTAAEYLAFEKNKHVLVIMTDMTNYCEALREVSSIHCEVPGRKGYPGYLYSDLSSLYERAGRIKGAKGSITQIPILTMPNDDISHPIPDLSGYITEGQIVLERDLNQKGIYPPVAGLPSLSRLMKDGIGEGFTREDHKDLSNQLLTSYARVKQIRNLVSIIGEEELSIDDKHHLKFGEKFEQLFLTQGEYENRDISCTLDLGWKALSILPREELLRVRKEFLEKYF